MDKKYFFMTIVVRMGIFIGRLTMSSPTVVTYSDIGFKVVIQTFFQLKYSAGLFLIQNLIRTNSYDSRRVITSIFQTLQGTYDKRDSFYFVFADKSKYSTHPYTVASLLKLKKSPSGRTLFNLLL